jgi:Domain of unknown function (DUF4347)/FG-GAP-like repeat
VLAGRRDLSAIHIVSHGSAGDLLLGRSGVNQGNLGEYEAALVGWRSALTEDADILLYGCEVGQGSAGLAFVQRLAEVTGADVAASDDLTGNAALGGDWILEVNIGEIESSLAVDPQTRSAFASTLALSFGNAVNYATGGSFPRGLTFGDFDGDGDQDIFVSNETSNNVSLLTNNSSGVFTTGTPFSGGGNTPHPLVVANFDGVNGLDIAVPLFTSNQLGLLKSNNSGGFQPAAIFAIGNFPVFAVTADFNKDGRPDVATANLSSNNISVLLNNGNGGFSPATEFATGSSPYSIATADFNADGNQDMAVVNTGSRTVSLLFGDGTGSFTAGTALTLTGTPKGITASDFNDDGRIDLAIAATNNLFVILNTGGGNFGTTSSFSLGTNVFAVTSGDFNGDGRPDIAAVDRTSPNGTVKVLENNGAGSFNSPISYNIGNSPSGVIASDFNGDGKIDLATSNAGGNNVSILLNTLTTVAPTLSTSIIPVLNSSTSIAAPSGAIGTLVSNLVDLTSIPGGIDNVIDPDSSVTGISIYFTNNTNGNWWYSLDDGSEWKPLGIVSKNSAKLLAANSSTRLYFQPNPGFSGVIPNGLSFNAWDRSTGANGGNADVTITGSITSFSSESATIQVATLPPLISLTTPDNAAAEAGNDTGTYRVSSTSSGGSQSIQLAIDTTNSAHQRLWHHPQRRQHHRRRHLQHLGQHPHPGPPQCRRHRRPDPHRRR